MRLIVTQNAIKRIKKLIALQQDQESILRISVDGGGCSGFMYRYEMLPKSVITQQDYLIEQDNVTIVVDELSQNYMNGCVVDFIEELGNEYFEIKNPNAVGKCGCGNSFSI